MKLLRLMWFVAAMTLLSIAGQGQTEPDLQLTSFVFQSTPVGRTHVRLQACGEIKNRSQSVAYDDLLVQVGVYVTQNRQKVRVQTQEDRARALGPGETWKFKCKNTITVKNGEARLYFAEFDQVTGSPRRGR